MRGLCYFYLSILTQVSSSTYKVTGLVGHDVTLPCRYDTQTHGVLSFCWGRGMVPNSKCSSTILSQDGAVLFMESPRYQLLGRVSDGDVSLTILDAQRSDAGVYGCRIEIPGWFNDEKVNIHLVMKEAPVEQLVTQDWTVTVSGRPEILTAFSTSTKNEDIDEPTFDKIGTTEENLKAFLVWENIGRVAAIFFFAIIVILVFAFWKSFLPKRKLQHLNSSTAESIYETL